jgi:hypothetical protein
LNSIVMTVCAREEVAFIYVLPIVRFLYPSSILSSIAAYESTGCFERS